MMNKVSFVIPVYKVESFLSKCIYSVLSQTYNNFEVIAVDDGSPDNSGNILDELAEKDNRLHVIHTENHGVSAARNIGLESSTGDYILFVDSDDYIDENYASYFVELIESHNADMALSQNFYIGENKMHNSDDVLRIISAQDAQTELYLNKTGVAVWNKIYRKSFLDENKIRFHTDLWFAEGMTFNIECMISTDKVVMGNQYVYHQTENDESATRKFNLESFYCGLKAMDYQYTLLDKANKQLINSWQYHKYLYNKSIVFGIISSKKEKKYKDELKKRKVNLMKGFPVLFKVHMKKSELFKFACFIFSPEIYIKLKELRIK